ncbi:MAG: GNAT family N-acetyltransferase [Bdellovibrionales bacterium]|nr:GNAT family N-acetyltransferase [Bdellovibrionales bacterium]
MIQSKRLLLRRFNLSDLEWLTEMESDPEVMKYTGPGKALTPEQSKQRLEKLIKDQPNHEPYGVWGAESLSTGELICWCMLKRERHSDLELGYMIAKQHWGRGYATEVSKLLVDFAFLKNNESRIVALTAPENIVSNKVLEKAGFRFVETRQRESHGKVIKDNFYEILKV